jgi:hypothetical protein
LLLYWQWNQPSCTIAWVDYGNDLESAQVWVKFVWQQAKLFARIVPISTDLTTRVDSLSGLDFLVTCVNEFSLRIHLLPSRDWWASRLCPRLQLPTASGLFREERGQRLRGCGWDRREGGMNEVLA